MKFVLSDKLAREMGPFNTEVAMEAMKAAAEEESERPHEWLRLINRQALILQPIGDNNAPMTEPPATPNTGETG